MELSNEDNLRLNVLIANAEAIRIDEGGMTVYGLSGEKEMKVPLSPTCRSDKYLDLVRELLSGTVLGSPGGYPVFLRRWTRMGQVNNEDLDKLLMLGEPEAVIAVSRSNALDDELARKAWWCAPYAETARRMLENPAVVGGAMGPVLAEFLVEHLPFETEHQDMLDTVRLVLQPGLIKEQTRQKLWDSGRRQKTYRIGFLACDPEQLPERHAPRHDFETHRDSLQALGGNPYAEQLRKLLDSGGQSFMQIALDVMKRPADQDVVSALLNAIGDYFGVGPLDRHELRELHSLEQGVEQFLADEGNEALWALRQTHPQLEREIAAMLFLGLVSDYFVTPIFAHTDAVGTVMRKKIEPVLTPIQHHFKILQGLVGDERLD